MQQRKIDLMAIWLAGTPTKKFMKSSEFILQMNLPTEVDMILKC